MAACDPTFSVDEVNAAAQIAAQNALLQAAAYLEQAVHAGTEADTWCALAAVGDRLHWALADLAIVADEDQLDQATCLSNTVDAMVAAGGVIAAGGVELSGFQLSMLLPLQSQIAEIVADPLVDWSAAQDEVNRDTNLALLGVLGAFVVVIGAAGYIDYKQSHGGYHRGAPGVARPIVQYRYPRG